MSIPTYVVCVLVIPVPAMFFFTLYHSIFLKGINCLRSHSTIYTYITYMNSYNILIGAQYSQMYVIFSLLYIREMLLVTHKIENSNNMLICIIQCN